MNFFSYRLKSMNYSIAEIQNFVGTKPSTNLQRILEGIIGILSEIIYVTNVVWLISHRELTAPSIKLPPDKLELVDSD